MPKRSMHQRKSHGVDHVQLLESRICFAADTAALDIIQPTTQQVTLANDGDSQTLEVSLAQAGWITARATKLEDNQWAHVSVSVGGGGADLKSNAGGAGVGVNLIADETSGNQLSEGTYEVTIHRQDIPAPQASFHSKPVTVTVGLLADYAGDQQSTARQLGSIAGSMKVTGFVGNDPNVVNTSTDLNLFHGTKGMQVTATVPDANTVISFLQMQNGKLRRLATSQGSSSQFITAEVGDGDAWLQVVRRGQSNSAYTITLSTNSNAPSIRLSTDTLYFSAVALRQNSSHRATLPLEIFNDSADSTRTVWLTSTVDSRFRINLRRARSFRIKPGESVVVNISFDNVHAPSIDALPKFEDDIIVKSNDPNSMDQSVHTKGSLEPGFVKPNSGFKVLATRYNDFSNLQAFAGPPLEIDAHQGSIDDCYLLASATATAAMSPDIITQAITPIDGGYAVTLKRFDSTIVVNVDAELPTDNVGNIAYDRPNSQGAIWLALFEKAYAASQQYSYANIAPDGGGEATDAFYALGANWADEREKHNEPALATPAKLIQYIQQAENLSQPVLIDTLKHTGPILSPNHSYSVNHIDYDNSGNATSIVIHNPVGDVQTTGFANDGYIVISPEELWKEMGAVCIAGF